MVTTVRSLHLNSINSLDVNQVSVNRTVSRGISREEYTNFSTLSIQPEVWRVYTRPQHPSFTGQSYYIKGDANYTLNDFWRPIYQTVWGTTSVSPTTFGIGLFSSFPTSCDFNVEIYAREYYGINYPALKFQPVLLGSFSGTSTSPGGGHIGDIVEHTFSGLTLDTEPNLLIYNPSEPFNPVHYVNSKSTPNFLSLDVRVTPVNFRDARHFGMGFVTFMSNHSTNLDLVMPGDSITFSGSDVTVVVVDGVTWYPFLWYGYALDPSITKVTLTGIPNSSNAYPSVNITSRNVISRQFMLVDSEDMVNLGGSNPSTQFKKIVYEIVKRPTSWSEDIPIKYRRPVFAIRPFVDKIDVNSIILSFS